MVVDPSRKLTPLQKAKLEWYADMDREGQRWREDLREQNRQEAERRAKQATRATS